MGLKIALSNRLKLEYDSFRMNSKRTRQKLRWYDPMKRRRYAGKTPGIDDGTGEVIFG